MSAWLIARVKRAATNCYVHSCPCAVLTHKKDHKSPVISICHPTPSIHIQVAVHYAAHIGLAPSPHDRIKVPRSGSIIITDMPHRPAQLLCISPGFHRSMPSPLQWAFPILPLPPRNRPGRHIMAHPHSGYTYPHVLYAFPYSVVSPAAILACPVRICEVCAPAFFCPPPPLRHTSL